MASLATVAVVDRCCWSTASGETEGDDEVEDVDDGPDDDDDEEEAEDGEDDDEENVIDEDNVFAVEGKICTISIGAGLCSSDLLQGEFSGVLVTSMAVEPGRRCGRALSIELNSLSATGLSLLVLLPIAVVLLLLLFGCLLLLETFKAPSVLLVLTDSSYSSDEDGVDSEDEDWIGRRFRGCCCSTDGSDATCAATGARVGCCCCC